MEELSQIFIVLAYIAAIGFLIFGIEDVLFDLQFVRYLLKSARDPNITLGELKAKPEKYIAVMVPAWKEGGVVNRMADYAVKILDYERYDIFIGVYPNDSETSACVEAIARTCPRIHQVMCPNPGPTSKADCLNAIYRAIRLREIPDVREYEILALHDAEDVLHPLTLKIYNFFVPDRVDMGQIPVFPLEHPPLENWIGNTYMDDFTELHLKDMLARQQMGGVVPSAGVGTAFSRRAVDFLGDHNEGDPFLVGNLTEDYFIGIQLKRAGFPAGFINYPIDRVAVKTDAEGREVSRRSVTELVAVRENFPSKFWDAVRQRSRWILGISMQCWELAGWEGSIPVRYTLFRDRRAPLVHLINAIGYVVILSALIQWAILQTPLAVTSYWRPLFTPDSLLWGIILIDTVFLIYRLMVKVYYVQLIYGWKQAFFSIPRYPLGNFINFFATCRAVWMYFQNRVLGKQLVWLKTTHVFPDQAELRDFAASIEALLVKDGVVPQEVIEQLMRERIGTSLPLRLLQLRLIEEEQFTESWARFSGLPERTLTLEDLDLSLLDKLPETDHSGLLPFHRNANGSIGVAFLEPPQEKLTAELEQQLGAKVEGVLITRTNLRIIRDFGYSRRVLPPYRTTASKVLRDIDPGERRKALEIQNRTGRRFSDLAVDMGLISIEACRNLWGEIFQAEPTRAAGLKLDDEAFQILGPVYCSLHRLAPVEGDGLLFQEVLHPEVLKEIETRLGHIPRLLADTPASTRRFLRAVFESVKPEELVLERLVANGDLTSARAGEIRALLTLVKEPLPRLLGEFAGVPSKAVHRAFLEVARLSPAPDAAPDIPDGIMRPGFSESNGSEILEAADGRVTFALTHFLPPADFSQVCTRLNSCAVRFVATTSSL